MNVPGSIVECGVFKGTSLMFFAFRQLLGNSFSSKIIGQTLPIKKIKRPEMNGLDISVSQLISVFERSEIKNFELVIK